MPKTKKRSVDSSNVLCSRDVSKIRKLMRENIDEEKLVVSKSLTDEAAIIESESDNEESEMEEGFQLDLPDFDSCGGDVLEDDEDWKKFFKSTSDNKELVTELKKNLTESKLKVN
ncbi:unnamed protein product [Schistosoma mattheei]|uniref:Uncharacterized protein n=1 Tax=Schistosoma mattheei TaxID=31246 RepID=A0A183Q246_9TREM|nr:unnamed protein product [Schistosoma mattheei]